MVFFGLSGLMIGNMFMQFPTHPFSKTEPHQRLQTKILEYFLVTAGCQN